MTTTRTAVSGSRHWAADVATDLRDRGVTATAARNLEAQRLSAHLAVVRQAGPGFAEAVAVQLSGAVDAFNRAAGGPRLVFLSNERTSQARETRTDASLVIASEFTVDVNGHAVIADHDRTPGLRVAMRLRSGATDTRHFAFCSAGGALRLRMDGVEYDAKDAVRCIAEPWLKTLLEA